MSTTADFVRCVVWRLRARALLGALTRWLCAGTVLAALLVLADRVLSLGVGDLTLVAVPCGAALLGGLATAWARWPSRLAAALAADARLGLEERLSTAMAAPQGLMADLLRRDAERHVSGADPHREFPVRPPGGARILIAGAGALLVALLLPQMDLLGWGAARQRRQAERQAVREATASARSQVRSLREAARRRGLEGAAAALGDVEDRLAQLAESGADAAQARAQARELQATVNAAREAPLGDGGRAPPEDALGRRDFLAGASRVLERCRRQLGDGAAGGGVPRPAAGLEGEDEGPAAPGAFVRADDVAVPAPESRELEWKLVTAGQTADAATARRQLPWRYRGVVRRYFSPDTR
ncbi:MAG: hypothetical protein ACLF0G_10130 [Candidatus Brocadiia bacterium]